MSDHNAVADLIDCAPLPLLIADSDINLQILAKTPEPQFVRNVKSNPIHHQHTNAPYLQFANINPNVGSLRKDIAFGHSPVINKREVQLKSEYNIDIEDSMILPNMNHQHHVNFSEKKTYINIQPQNQSINVTNFFDSILTQHRPFEQITPVPSQQLIKATTRESIQTPTSSRRLNPYEVLDYHQKLNELNYKINQIISINESLEIKIDDITEKTQSKSDENKRLNKKVIELNEKIREQSADYENIEQAYQQYRIESSNTISDLKKKSALNMNQIYNQIAGEKLQLEQMNKKQVNLVTSIQDKRRQLMQIKQFSSKIQQGISQMRLS